MSMLDVALLLSTQTITLTFLSSLQMPHRLVHWALVLQGYNLEVCYIKGQDSVVVDTLPRAHHTWFFCLFTPFYKHALHS